MWKPLSIVSGLLLLAAGGIMYTQVGPDFKSENKQLAEAKQNKTSAELNRTASNNASENAKKDLSEAKVELAANIGAREKAETDKKTKESELAETQKKRDEDLKALTDLEQKLKDLGGLERLVAELK